MFECERCFRFDYILEAKTGQTGQRISAPDWTDWTENLGSGVELLPTTQAGYAPPNSILSIVRRSLSDHLGHIIIALRDVAVAMAEAAGRNVSIFSEGSIATTVLQGMGTKL